MKKCFLCVGGVALALMLVSGCGVDDAEVEPFITDGLHVVESLGDYINELAASSGVDLDEVKGFVVSQVGETLDSVDFSKVDVDKAVEEAVKVLKEGGVL